MNTFDNTIKKMQDIINNIQDACDKKLKEADSETAEKLKSVSNKTIDTINEASVKLKGVVDKISDEEELSKFLDRVLEKCDKAAKYAYYKFDEILPTVKEEKIKVEDDTKSTMEKFLDNENVKSAVNMANSLKDSFMEFMNKEETKEAIENVKKSAINVADKGLDTLIKALDKAKEALDNSNSENKNQE